MASHQDISIDAHAPEAQLHPAIKAACRALLPGWEALQDADIDISFITGGISNALFKVQPAGSSGGAAAAAATAALAPVAFRLYGDNTEQFIDRSHEVATMRLAHQHGFGPQLLATFANGRIEEFLPMRSLEPDELAAPEFVPAIAATLRRFHGIPAPGERTSRTPFGRIYEWLDMAQHFTFKDPEKQKAFEAFDFAALRAEVRAVEAAAGALHSPLAFCHNDLLSGNVMVPLAGGGQQQQQQQPQAEQAQQQAQQLGQPEQQQRQQGRHGAMTFIDFEYADWAPRGHDWGNHFCEYAGFDCDYSRYPSRQQAADFIRHYLAAGGEAADEATLEACVAEANVYALAAHQYWGTWSFLQAKWSKIDFDYLQYAQLRWGEYFCRKDEFLAAAAKAAAEKQR